MHPAPSLILFTTLSGLGLGLLFWLGLDRPDFTGWAAFGYFTLAYLLAAGGLVSSVFHLANPRNAPKAFTQWRTSWLSREAWLAPATLLVMALYGIGRVFFGAHWAVIGALGSALAVVTVLSTAMIYTQLRTVPRWNSWTTPVLFLLLALGGGALLAGESEAAALALTLGGILQVYAWSRGDRRLAESGTDLGTGTGLGSRGSVRAFEPPHTGPNYLTREMAFRVARKHSDRLRVLAIGLGYALPVLLVLTGTKAGAVIAVPLHVVGIAAGRWLFYAEAEHVVSLYYGAAPTRA